MSELPVRISRKIEDLQRFERDVTPGRIAVDPERCNGCGMCVRACPGALLEVVDGRAQMTAPLPLCIACGDCVAICPTEAVALVDYLQFQRRYRYLNRGRPEGPRRF